jgi:tyrosine-protein kinase Etk/Wzc
MRKHTMSDVLHHPGVPVASVVTAPNPDLNFLDLLIVFGRHKKVLFGLPLLGGGAALALAMSMTPIFTSTAKILPPQQQSSGMAAVLGQLGGMAGLAGVAGVKTSRDIYIGILESRTIADILIKRFDLQVRYKTKTMDDARIALSGASEVIDSKKDGLIGVAASDPDPKFAAALANGYVEELTRLTQTFAVTDASQRRLFFERQLKESKDKLADAEIAMRTTQEKTGMIQPEGQVQAIIGTIAGLKGQIAAKEIQIGSMRTFATTQNPEYVRAQEELRGMQGQLSRLEQNRPSKDGDFMVPSGRIPAAGIEYIRSLRDMKYYETMYEMLAKQYEMARLDEAKEGTVIQVLDVAVPSERKSKPKRALITLGGIVVGTLLGILITIFSEVFARSRRDPANAWRWQQLTGTRKT